MFIVGGKTPIAFKVNLEGVGVPPTELSSTEVLPVHVIAKRRVLRKQR
jgi:hypothetical protein